MVEEILTIDDAPDLINQDPTANPTDLLTTYICTADEVFNFAGTEQKQRANKQTTVEGTIYRVVKLIQDQIGRYITPVNVTVAIHDGRYCSICGNTIFMHNFFYDINSIIDITEDGAALVENVDYVINKPNQIEKINGAWTSNKLGIIINGNFGMGYAGGFDYDENLIQLDLAFLAHRGMKQIVIEEVATKCGLLTRIVNDGQGSDFEVTRTNLSPETIKAIKRYEQPVVG